MILQHSALAVAKSSQGWRPFKVFSLFRGFFPLSLGRFENASQFGAVCFLSKETELLLRSIIISWRSKLQDRFG